jgi:ferredoxin
VVEAVGQGIEAAESIHRYLRQTDLREGRASAWPKPEDIEIETFSPVRWGKRAVMAELPIAQRVSSFDEVELGFSAEDAMAEANRCLSCAVCSECLQCVTACQRGAIRHDDATRMGWM